MSLQLHDHILKLLQDNHAVGRVMDIKPAFTAYLDTIESRKELKSALEYLSNAGYIDNAFRYEFLGWATIRGLYPLENKPIEVRLTDMGMSKYIAADTYSAPLPLAPAPAGPPAYTGPGPLAQTAPADQFANPKPSLNDYWKARLAEPIEGEPVMQSRNTYTPAPPVAATFTDTSNAPHDYAYIRQTMIKTDPPAAPAPPGSGFEQKPLMGPVFKNPVSTDSSDYLRAKLSEPRGEPVMQSKRPAASFDTSRMPAPENAFIASQTRNEDYRSIKPATIIPEAPPVAKPQPEEIKANATPDAAAAAGKKPDVKDYWKARLAEPIDGPVFEVKRPAPAQPPLAGPGPNPLTHQPKPNTELPGVISSVVKQQPFDDFKSADSHNLTVQPAFKEAAADGKPSVKDYWKARAAEPIEGPVLERKRAEDVAPQTPDAETTTFRYSIEKEIAGQALNNQPAVSTGNIAAGPQHEALAGHFSKPVPADLPPLKPSVKDYWKARAAEPIEGPVLERKPAAPAPEVKRAQVTVTLPQPVIDDMRTAATAKKPVITKESIKEMIADYKKSVNEFYKTEAEISKSIGLETLGQLPYPNVAPAAKTVEAHEKPLNKPLTAFAAPEIPAATAAAPLVKPAMPETEPKWIPFEEVKKAKSNADDDYYGDDSDARQKEFARARDLPPTPTTWHPYVDIKEVQPKQAPANQVADFDQSVLDTETKVYRYVEPKTDMPPPPPPAKAETANGNTTLGPQAPMASLIPGLDDVFGAVSFFEPPVAPEPVKQAAAPAAPQIPVPTQKITAPEADDHVSGFEQLIPRPDSWADPDFVRSPKPQPPVNPAHVAPKAENYNSALPVDHFKTEPVVQRIFPETAAPVLPPAPRPITHTPPVVPEADESIWDVFDYSSNDIGFEKPKPLAAPLPKPADDLPPGRFNDGIPVFKRQTNAGNDYSPRAYHPPADSYTMPAYAAPAPQAAKPIEHAAPLAEPVRFVPEVPTEEPIRKNAEYTPPFIAPVNEPVAGSFNNMYNRPTGLVAPPAETYTAPNPWVKPVEYQVPDNLPQQPNTGPLNGYAPPAGYKNTPALQHDAVYQSPPKPVVNELVNQVSRPDFRAAAAAALSDDMEGLHRIMIQKAYEAEEKKPKWLMYMLVGFTILLLGGFVVWFLVMRD